MPRGETTTDLNEYLANEVPPQKPGAELSSFNCSYTISLRKIKKYDEVVQESTNMSVRHSPKMASSHTEKATDEEINEPQQGSERFTPEQQKHILRRVDRRLIATTGLMYCISLMDRNNLGAAALAGMNTDLNLVGFRYVWKPPPLNLPGTVLISSSQSIIALVFFIPYTLFQPLATILCRKIGPRIFLSVITIAWGLVMVSKNSPRSIT